MRREKIEWTNSWHQYAYDTNRERWLLIGDSVSRAYRPHLQNAFDDKAIDFFATSYSLEDEYLIHDLRPFMEHDIYSYSRILVNIGAHHGYYYDHTRFEIEYANFSRAYNNLLDMLSSYCNNIICLTCTPQVYPDNVNMFDYTTNRHIVNRNEAIKSISQAKGYDVIDLYELMDEFNYIFVDQFHLAENGDWFIADAIKRHILGKPIEKWNWKYCNNISAFDQIIKNNNEKIYIYGAGKRGKILLDYISLHGIKVGGFVISDYQEIKDNDYEITRLSDYLRNSKETVLIRTIQPSTDLARPNICEYVELSEDVWRYIQVIKTFSESV